MPQGISACEPECTNVARDFGAGRSLKNAVVVLFEPSRQSILDRNPWVDVVRRPDTKQPETDHNKPNAVESDASIATLMVIGNAEHGQGGMGERVCQTGAPGVANCRSTLTRFGKPPKLTTLLNFCRHVERLPSHPG